MNKNCGKSDYIFVKIYRQFQSTFDQKIAKCSWRLKKEKFKYFEESVYVAEFKPQWIVNKGAFCMDKLRSIHTRTSRTYSLSYIVALSWKPSKSADILQTEIFLLYVDTPRLFPDRLSCRHTIIVLLPQTDDYILTPDVIWVHYKW